MRWAPIARASTHHGFCGHRAVGTTSTSRRGPSRSSRCSAGALFTLARSPGAFRNLNLSGLTVRNVDFTGMTLESDEAFRKAAGYS